MRHLFLRALSAIVFVAAAGCDAVNEFVPFSGGNDKRQEEQRARQRSEAEEAKRLADERAALAQHVAALSRSLAVDLESATKAVDAATADRTALAERIRELSDANADKPRQVTLAAILADARVCELARKYMDRDFRLVRLEFLERTREALAARRAFDASRQRASGAYDAEVAAAKDGVRYMTDKELSEMLKVSRHTLQQYRNKGLIPFTYCQGKVLYKEQDVEELLERNYQPARWKAE